MVSMVWSGIQDKISGRPPATFRVLSMSSSVLPHLMSFLIFGTTKHDANDHGKGSVVG